MSKDQTRPSIVLLDDELESQEKDQLETVISSDTNAPQQHVLLSKGMDEAMRYAIENHDENIQLDPETERRLIRKIDLYLLPVMCLVYCVQFMDKLSNSYASVLGLRKDLKMTGDMYGWTGSAFYIGYLFFEFPASYLLQRLPVAKTASVFMLLWGVVLCLHAVPQYEGFIALRTLLGMLESSVTPAFTIITLQWYKKEEQFLRVAIWFAFNGVGIILGGAISYGLSIHGNSYSMEAWKLIFVVTGCITIFLGLLVLVHIPDTPAGAWFLSDSEKKLVIERIRSNQQGFGSKKFKKYQFVEALLDYKTWLMFAFAFCNNVPNGGITNFGNILLVSDIGYTPNESLLMQMPAGAVLLVGCIGFSYCVRWYPHRMFWAITGTMVVVFGQCLLAFANNNKMKLAGLAISSMSSIGIICILSLISSNVAGHTKKVTTSAIFLIGYCVGNLVGPQTFRNSEAPGYQGAKTAIVSCGFIGLFVLCVIWASYIWENKRKDKIDLSKHQALENQEFADLTDKENVFFRYST